MVVWDYFMRRKGLLFLILMIFAVSGMLSGYLLSESTTYLVDYTPTLIEEVPDSSEQGTSAEIADFDSDANVSVPISEEEPAESQPENISVDILTETESDGSAAFFTENTTDDSQTAEPPEIPESAQGEEVAASTVDVPLTRTGDSQTASSPEQWLALSTTLQYTAWGIFAVLFVSFAIIIFMHWSAWRSK